MEINWGIFLPALLLLLYPLDRLLPKRMKGRTCEYLTDPAVRHRHTWWRWQPELWVDALRLYVGAWSVNFAVAPVLPDSGKTVQLVIGAVMLAALGSQMFTRRKEDTVLAPFGFLLAASLVFLPLGAALATCVLAALAMLAFREYVAFFIAGAPAAAGLGFVQGGSVAFVALVAGLFVLPVVVGSLARRKLVLAVRSRADVERVVIPLR